MTVGGDRPDLGDRMMAADGSPRWFAYVAADSTAVEDNASVEVLRFRADPYAGPFWAVDEHLSDDFVELHRWLGISRQTYNDATAWNDRCTRSDVGAAELELERQQLLEKLRSEVHAGITVL